MGILANEKWQNERRFGETRNDCREIDSLMRSRPEKKSSVHKAKTKMEPEKKLETIKKDIRSLLISSPIGLRVQDLLDDYRAMLGKHLPFQELGYNSAMEMIKHMPDVVVPVFHAGGVMYLKAVADSSTKHIKKLVEQQRKTGRISRIRKPAEEALRRPPPGSFVPSTIRVKLKELMKSYPEGLSTDMLATAYLRRFGRELRCETFGFPTFKKFLEACSDLVDIVENNQDGKKSSTIYAKNHTTSPQNIVKNALFNKLKSDLTTKAKQTIPNGPPKQANLPTTQEKVPVSRSNSLTSPRKTNSLTSPRRTSTSRIPPTEKKVKSLMDLEDNFSQSPKPTAVKDPVIKIKSGVSDEVKKELSSLLAGKPNGMWLARLPFEYKRQFSKDLDIKGAGYFNLIEMIGSLPDMITMQRPVKNGDWLLTGLQKVSQAVREDPIPNDAVTAHGIFKKVSYPTEGQMQIFIVHISDPGSFCFHYCEKKEAHDQLMQNIQSFYNSVASQKYLLPSKLTKPGQVCCAIYEEDGEWYRAEIAKVISDREIEVFYVDYGNLSRVAPSKLRILRKDFIELPAMGIRGRLANILPKASFDWSAEAGKRFFELANNRILLGNICGNDKGAVLLHLIDANKKQQVHINDVLVVEGFAIYKDPIPTAAPALNPATRLPNNVFLNQQKPHLDVNIPSQGLATYDSTMASALIPYLFQQMQQGQQFINGQPRPFTQEDLARALSSMMVGNNKMPQTQNTVTTSQLDKEPMVSVNSQQSAPAPEEQSSLASFINAVNSEVDVQNTSDDSSDVFEAESEDSMACFVNIRRLLIPEAYTVHAINIEGKPYVTSGEIAALFWHGDILRAMLRREKAAIEKVVISRDENGELFNELIKYDVGGVQDANGVKDYMTVYQLESLPTILDIFKHKSEELKKMVKVEVNQYKINPESYWLAEQTDDSSDDIEEDSQSLELELEELRLLLQAMQFRRKRLMNALVNKKSSASAVDELRQVEEEVERIRKKVQIKEGITK